MALRLRGSLAATVSLKAVAGSAPALADGTGEATASAIDGVSTALLSMAQRLRAEEARKQRTINPYASRAVQYRIEQVTGAEQVCVPKDGNANSFDQDIADQYLELIDHPNAYAENDTYGGVAGPALDDMLVLNRGVIQKLLYQDRTPGMLRDLDGARLVENKNWLQINVQSGMQRPQGPRYTYRGRHSPQDDALLESDEVMVLAPQALSYDPLGLSPMQTIRTVLMAWVDTFRRMHMQMKYGVPPGVFVLPGAKRGTPIKMRILWDQRMAGRAAPAFMNLPEKSKWVEMAGTDLQRQGAFLFHQILIQTTAMAFALSPFVLGYTELVTRANAESQLEVTDDGIITILKYLRQKQNRDILGPFKNAIDPEGINDAVQNVYQTFPILDVEHEPEDVAATRQLMGPVGYAAVNEARVRQGLEPYKQREGMSGDGIPDWMMPLAVEPWMVCGAGLSLPWSWAMRWLGLDPDYPPLDSMQSAGGLRAFSMGKDPSDEAANPEPVPDQLQKADAKADQGGDLNGQQVTEVIAKALGNGTGSRLMQKALTGHGAQGEHALMEIGERVLTAWQSVRPHEVEDDEAE